jgi:hypothetical protein
MVGLSNSPTAEGTKGMPLHDGATNWFSPSYSPATGCSILRRSKNAAFKKTDGRLGAGQDLLERFAKDLARPYAGACLDGA